MGDIYRDKNGSLVSTGNNQADSSVALGNAAYNWGTAAATLGQRPRYIQLAAAAAPRILSLPAAALCAGWEVFITSSGNNSITLNGPALLGTITTLATAHCYCDGTTWHTFGLYPAS